MCGTLAFIFCREPGVAPQPSIVEKAKMDDEVLSLQIVAYSDGLNYKCHFIIYVHRNATRILNLLGLDFATSFVEKYVKKAVL